MRRMPTLFDASDIAYVKELHRRYLGGEFSLRGMAKRLGLSYRDLYAILEELGLPLTASPEKTSSRSKKPGQKRQTLVGNNSSVHFFVMVNHILHIF